MMLLLPLALAGSALAARLPMVNVRQASSPLDVKVDSVGNSAVKASITNVGSKTLKLFTPGSILDSTAVEKAEVYSGSEAVAFNGIRVRVFTDEADEDAFQVLRPNQTIQTEWDPAEVHDLSTGGLFDFRVRGSFPTADLNCTTITGSIPFDSILSSEVDGVAAADVHHSFQRMLRMKARRSDLGSDCTGTEGTAQTTALSNCAKLASAAATAASDGAAAKMTEYFGSSSASTRTTVANIFNKIATECGTTTGGVAALHCTDQYGYCGSSVLAYTIPEMNYEVSCPIYFSRLSALASRCHGQDQATTTLHETTHLNQIKGTQDYGYGYSVATQLTTQQALNNADNYALFANAIDLQC